MAFRELIFWRGVAFGLLVACMFARLVDGPGRVAWLLEWITFGLWLTVLVVTRLNRPTKTGTTNLFEKGRER